MKQTKYSKELKLQVIKEAQETGKKFLYSDDMLNAAQKSKN